MYSRDFFLFKENLDVQVNNVYGSHDGRKLWLNFKINEYIFAVVNINAQNDIQNNFF